MSCAAAPAYLRLHRLGLCAIACVSFLFEMRTCVIVAGVPGLAMSRSVGDTVAKQAGVCSEVEIQEARHPCFAVGYLSFGPIEKNIMLSVTSACARRTGATARVERRRASRSDMRVASQAC